MSQAEEEGSPAVIGGGVRSRRHGRRTLIQDLTRRAVEGTRCGGPLVEPRSGLWRKECGGAT